MRIFCCNCEDEVECRLTDGKEIYPHRNDLGSFPFWKCDQCGGHVGCHHKTKNRTKPLGCIPSPEIKDARRKLHALIDPIWKSGKMSRKSIYKHLSKAIGREYHTAEIRSIQEARIVYRAASQLKFSPKVKL